MDLDADPGNPLNPDPDLNPQHWLNVTIKEVITAQSTAMMR
jgi:hypothetical protein